MTNTAEAIRVVVAPDSFKGSASSREICNFIEAGMLRFNPNIDVVKIPISDGGEGTLSVLVDGLGGQMFEHEVIGPLGSTLIARYGLLSDNSAIVEMAESSGLCLVPSDKKDPFISTSYGTGQLIQAALDRGVDKIYIGLGGSSTNDGGMGMAQALGASFKDSDGNELGYGAGELARLHSVDLSNLDSRLRTTSFVVLSDVDNPLTGPSGASMVFARQKGAKSTDLAILDECLLHYGQIVSKCTGHDYIDFPGAGAAGGLGFACLNFFQTQITSGVYQILDMLNFEQKLEGASLVITGEGRIDEQTSFGKAPHGVTQIALSHNIPVIAIAGSVSLNLASVYKSGLDLVISLINEPMSLELALKNVRVLTENAAENALRAFMLGK